MRSIHLPLHIHYTFTTHLLHPTSRHLFLIRCFHSLPVSLFFTLLSSTDKSIHSRTLRSLSRQWLEIQAKALRCWNRLFHWKSQAEKEEDHNFLSGLGLRCLESIAHFFSESRDSREHTSLSSVVYGSYSGKEWQDKSRERETKLLETSQVSVDHHQ